MEQNAHKFRLRLNLFDLIVLVLVLALGGGFLWYSLRGGGDAASAGTVRYTIMFSGQPEGSHERIAVGDELEDTVKNYALGKVVSVTYTPATMQVLDQSSRCYVETTLDGYEDIYITVESACTVSESEILVDGGYEVRVGQVAYVRGPGYMGSGTMTAVERGA